MLGIIIFVILIIVIVATWINTKIILEEIDGIKKHLGISEEKLDDLKSFTENYKDEQNQEYHKL